MSVPPVVIILPPKSKDERGKSGLVCLFSARRVVFDARSLTSGMTRLFGVVGKGGCTCDVAGAGVAAVAFVVGMAAGGGNGGGDGDLAGNLCMK